jgi:uncharacterized protein
LSTAAPPLDAVKKPERITAMDAARGLAILGIFFVNIEAFATPFGAFVEWLPDTSSLLALVSYYFVQVFCVGKFYPLFSMLFGMGLVLQRERARSSGRPFVPLYLRRLAVLMLIGLAHGLLLWWGDILFLYSLCGLVLLVLSAAGARTLLIIAIVFAVLAAVFGLGCGTVGALFEQPVEAAAPAEDAADPSPPFQRLIEGFQTGAITAPQSPLWMEVETEAYREGPWLQAFLFRAMTWAFVVVFSIFGLGWTIVAMFFLGAALMKYGVFDPSRRRLLRLFVGLGLAALPLAILGAAAPQWFSRGPALIVRSFVQPVAGPLMALGYLGAITLLVDRARNGPLLGSLSSVGRTALTNYLLQTVLATFLMYHWGLGLFGTLTRPERVGLVVAIYVVQLVLSTLWLRRMRMGPVEWLWRAATYLRRPPLLREENSVTEPG